VPSLSPHSNRNQATASASPPRGLKAAPRRLSLPYDPEAIEKARAILPQIEYGKTPYDAAEGVEALLIATEWPEFRKLDWLRGRDAMARPLILDGRNLLVPADMKALGFE
jgi:UDP-glucose/GDP-mannose dehydrogenase family, UDP binding domain